MEEIFNEKILYLIVGSAITLFGAWVKSWIDQEAHCSNELFKLRISALNQIWSSFIEVKDIYALKIQFGFDQWNSNYSSEAKIKLDDFRKRVDENQIILGKEIIICFRELDNYLYVNQDNADQNSSQYVDGLNEILEKLSKKVNKNMNVRLHKIDLLFRT